MVYLLVFFTENQLGLMAPCYYNKYDDNSDGDDSDTAHSKYTSDNSDNASFRRSCHKYYGEIELTSNS